MTSTKTRLLACASALYLMTAVCLADTFEDSLQEALAAKARGDISGAKRALAVAQSELSNSPIVAATIPTQSADTASVPVRSMATSATDTTQVKEGAVFNHLKNNGFRFQLGPGLSGPDAAPASFAFDRNIQEGTDTTFNAAFTLGWSSALSMINFINPDTGEMESVPRGSSSLFGSSNLTWVWDASIQGNLSTGADAKADAWAFRFGGTIDHINPAIYPKVLKDAEELKKLGSQGYSIEAAIAELNRRHSDENASFYKGSWWSFSGKLEADKDFDNQRLSFELMMTPTTSIPGNGIWWWPGTGAIDDAPIKFIWRPYFGIDAGGQIVSDGAIDEVDDTLRGFGRLTAKLSLDFLAKAMGLPEIGLIADNTTNHLTSSGDTYNYLDTQLAFKFNRNVGFSLKYVNGEKPPNFKRVETFGGAFTVKF